MKLALLCSLVLCLCMVNNAIAQSAGPASSPTEIRIVPESAAMNEPASDVLDSVRYIPLETTKESTIREITQLEVTRDYIVIMDQHSKAIFLFDKKGKFVRKITQYNNKLFATVYGIHTDDHNKKIIVNGRVDGESTTLVFDFNGKNLLKDPLTPENFDDFYAFPNHQLLLSQSFPDTSSIWVKDAKGKTIQSLLPINDKLLPEEDRRSSENSFFYDTDTTAFYVRPYDYTVYSVSQTGQLNSPYRFVFPMNKSLPQDFLTNTQYDSKRRQMTQDKIFKAKLFCHNGNALLFILYSDPNFTLLAYHPESGMLYSVPHLQPDQASHFLPVAHQHLGQYSFGADKVFYTQHSSISLINAANEIKDRRTWLASLEPSLRAYFEKGDKYANPVIAAIYFKP